MINFVKNDSYYLHKNFISGLYMKGKNVMNNRKQKIFCTCRSVFLALLLVVMSLFVSACDTDSTDDKPKEKGSVSITVKNGFFEDGDRSVELKDGTSYTIMADERVGMYFDGWLVNGKISDLEEIFTAKADSTSGKELVYEATYRMSEGATFEDVTLGNIFSDFYSGRFGVTVDLNSTDITTEVIKEPFDIRNTVLKFTDDDNEAGGAVRIDIASVPGDFLVYSLDFYIESFTGNIPLSIKTGNYSIDFYAPGDKFKICDNNGLTIAYLNSEFDPKDWHNLKIMLSNGFVNGKGTHAFVFLDGVCVAESANVGSGSYSNTIAFSTSEQSKIVAYLDNIIAYRQNLTLAEETAFDPKFIIDSGNTAEDAYYQAALFLDEGALAALKEMDSKLFSENIYRWIANLYDPETSALYFSISGRDNYGYLPDIETVAQGYGILGTLGIGGASVVLNDEQKANLLAWIQTLQSNRDGYYYHPHWGVSIINSRLSRDLGNSGSSYGASGAFAFRLFDDANYRLSGGKAGYGGHTVASAYDNSLAGSLSYSTASAVSKVVLSAANSSMPVHLRSEENLVTHINDLWNSTCKVAGVHERHFCTDGCVLEEDSSDSYMKIVDGKLVITRGYRCTSCHECSHTLGHSYAFGHNVTSMGSQIKAVGYGTPTVMYFYDIQENVQASLRNKAEDNYKIEMGIPAWDALSDEEKELIVAPAKEAYIDENGVEKWNKLEDKDKAAILLVPENEYKKQQGTPSWNKLDITEQTRIREAGENGIWEEEITYNTISGLLKISGIPGAHGYEFLYAAEAIDSAIKGALFSPEDYIARREAIVSIYNPFNAINAIMGNIVNYGDDPSVRTEAMAIIRSQAEALIKNTSAKLECYLMPDGGYSYSMAGYCTNSQGQPVAVNGWNNGAGEGDVNGTALALGTRGALISCLGISVGAPFAGTRALYSEEGYDLDCNGKIEGQELYATHTDVFKSLITNKAPIQKIDLAESLGDYDFEGTDPLLPSSGEVISDGTNKVLKVIDDNGESGLYTTFISKQALGTEQRTTIKFDMKVIESNNTTTHQIFAGSSNSLYINVYYDDGEMSFANRHSGSIYQSLYDVTTKKVITVNAKEWFSVEIDVYIDGKNIDGNTYYGIFKITQDGVTKTAYLDGLYAYKAINTLSIYSLNSSKNTVYYDNVSCSVVVKPGVYDGEYHFDNAAQKIGDKLTASPTNINDTVYAIAAGETASFTPDKYSTSSVIYNFDFFHGSVNLSETKAGDRIYFVMKDNAGKKITGVYLVINEDETVTFYAANGQKLKLFGDGEDMTLDLDKSKWLELKLEYHYDIGRFDVVVKYADLNNNSYNKTVASTLVGVTVYENSAAPSGFSAFDIHCQSANGGKIFVDDMYIRNVLVP